MSISFFSEPQVQHILPILLLPYRSPTAPFPQTHNQTRESNVNKETGRPACSLYPRAIACAIPFVRDTIFLLLFQVPSLFFWSRCISCAQIACPAFPPCLPSRVSWMPPASRSPSPVTHVSQVLRVLTAFLGGYSWPKGTISGQ